MKTLMKLDDFGLLIWFLDDGTLITNPQSGLSARFATNCFSLSEHKTIKKWFWKVFKIEVVISPHLHKKKTTYFLRLNSNNTKNLMSLFSEFYYEIPECMRYKLFKP
jgi:hypothetical protein